MLLKLWVTVSTIKGKVNEMSERVVLKSKLGALSDIGKIIKPGDFVAVGGGWSCNKPMAVIREILRQRIGGLKAMSIVGGQEMEWLIAGNALKHLVFSFLSMEVFGLPNNFRRVVKSISSSAARVTSEAMMRRRMGWWMVSLSSGIFHHLE